MLNLVLTSDFPSTPNQVVLDRIRATAPRPRIAWVPPITGTGRDRFAAARQLFGAYALSDLEYCDIDEDVDQGQLARLDQFDVVYLTGGDPLAFRRNVVRSGLATRLVECLAAGRTVVAASGGAMQFTKNVSLFRLLGETLDDVAANRGECEGLGVVGYELLPHLNRFEPSFIETVRQYSRRVPHDVLALADGAAVVHAARDEFRAVGRVARFRNGAITESPVTT
jgi:peptidase E